MGVFLCVGGRLRWKFFQNPTAMILCLCQKCLCQKCQRYDMYMASCVPCTFGKTTNGLSVVNPVRSSYADVHSRSVRRKPAHSVAPPVTSSSCPVAPPVTSKSVAACSRPVAPPVSARSSPVSSPAPFGSRAPTVAVSPGSVAARTFSSPVPVVSSSSSVGASVSVVVSRPALSGSLASSVSVSPARSCPVGSLACPVSVSPVRPSPVVVPSVKFGSFSSGPAGSGSTVPHLVRPRVPLSVGSSFGRPVCFPFIPVVCFVLAVVPVLLCSPFGLVWSFLPVWR